MATKNAMRRDRWLKMKAEKEAEPPKADSRWKVGSSGDRKGWSKSINAELGSRKSREEQVWHKNVLHRDGHACVVCGSTENLEVDHIKPRSIYPELKFNMDNGQTLCHKHHIETATYGSKIRKLVAVKIENLKRDLDPQ